MHLLLFGIGVDSFLVNSGSTGLASHYYEVADIFGTCSNYPENPDYYVAMGKDFFDDNLCGQCVRVYYNGKTTIGPITQSASDCTNCIGISTQMFIELAGLESVDKLPIEYEIYSCPAGFGAAFSFASPTTSDMFKRGSDPAGYPALTKEEKGAQHGCTTSTALTATSTSFPTAIILNSDVKMKTSLLLYLFFLV